MKYIFIILGISSSLTQIYLPCLATHTLWPAIFYVFAPITLMTLLLIVGTIWLYKTTHKHALLTILVMGSFYLTNGVLIYRSTNTTNHVDVISYYKPQKTITIDGDIEPGFAYSLQQQIWDHPEADHIVLKSWGGSLEESLVATSILQHSKIKSVTVDKYCGSACTTMFFGLPHRQVYKDAEIDLHACDLLSKRGFLLDLAANSMRRQIIDIYQAAGVPTVSIAFAMNKGCDDSLDFSAMTLKALHITE